MQENEKIRYLASNVLFFMCLTMSYHVSYAESTQNGRKEQHWMSKSQPVSQRTCIQARLLQIARKGNSFTNTIYEALFGVRPPIQLKLNESF